MDKRAVGVFDSGLGGLTAVKRLMALAPGEDIVFFGDTARVPYGGRTPGTIAGYAVQDISFLLAHNVKIVVAACATVSSTLSADIAARVPVPLVTVIEPSAVAAATATRNKKIGVLGTSATIRSGAFARALSALDPDFEVVSNAAPLLATLVECGYTARDNAITKLAVDEYLAPLRQAGVDTVILGCTHYPIIADIIADGLGSGVTLIDSGSETAKHALALLDAADARNPSGGAYRFFTSDNPEEFSPLAELFLGGKLENGVGFAPPDDIPVHPCFKGAL